MKTVVDLPFNRLVGLECSDGGTVSVPSGAQYLNHLGTVHAGALLALAEAASGEWLLRSLVHGDGQGLDRLVPVVRRCEAKFRKPAQGRVQARAGADVGSLEKLRGELAAKGRGLISVQVDLHDENGTHALSGVFEWFIATTTPDPAGRSSGEAEQRS